jgi:acetyl esterase/lipase
MKKTGSIFLLAAAGLIFAGCQPEPGQDAIFYCPQSYPDQNLIIAKPADTSRTYPAVVYFHGNGQWAELYQSTIEATATRNYVGVAVNYEAPMESGTFGDALQMASQARCAIRFLRKHAIEYNINPDKIAVVGHSLGSTMAGPLGMIRDGLTWSAYKEAVQSAVDGAYGDPEFSAHAVLPAAYNVEDNPAELENTGYSSDVQAVIIMSGVLDVTSQSTFCKRAHPLFNAPAYSSLLPAGCSIWNDVTPNVNLPVTAVTGDPGSQVPASGAPETRFRAEAPAQIYGGPLTKRDANGDEVIVSQNPVTVELLPSAVRLGNAMSPIAYGPATDYRPPMLLLHGGVDTTVPPEQALIAGRYLRANQRVAKTVIFDTSGHNINANAYARTLWLTFLDVAFEPQYVNTSAGFDAAYQRLPIAGNAAVPTANDYFCKKTSVISATHHCDP